MEVKVNSYVENFTIILNEQEAELLKDIILFAFDYESLKPNSLYTREKILGKKLIELLDTEERKKSIKVDIDKELEKEKK